VEEMTPFPSGRGEKIGAFFSRRYESRFSWGLVGFPFFPLAGRKVGARLFAIAAHPFPPFFLRVETRQFLIFPRAVMEKEEVFL